MLKTIIIGCLAITTMLAVMAVKNQGYYERKEDVAEAQDWLERAKDTKNDAGFRDLALDCVKKSLNEKRVTLEKVGITQQELNKLEKEIDVAEAQDWLERAKNTKNDAGFRDLALDCVKKSLNEKRVTLEKVGITQQELDELEKEIDVAEAQDWLERAKDTKNNADSRDLALDCVIKLLNEERVTLEKVGITQQELDELKKEIDVAEAQDWLERAKDTKYDADFRDLALDCVIKSLNEKRVTLEKVGITQQELDELEKEILKLLNN